jgi:predicted ATPase
MNEQGNVWKKWDLHTHTPGTIHNDQFKGGWGRFLQEVEKSDISVLGITDYYSIDNYYRVMDYKHDGRLANIEMIFPNIEIRLDYKAKDNRYINYHVIFDPSIADYVQEYFLSKLKYDQGDTAYYANRSDFIRLGYKINPNVGSDKKALIEGTNNFKVHLPSLIELLNDGRFKNKHFIITAGSDSDGVNALLNDQGYGTRNQVLYYSDAVFTTNPRSIKIFAGNGTDAENNYLKSLQGGIKPVFEGSDAHSSEQFGKRWTWVKAESSFDGLMQTKFEPTRRVRVETESMSSPQTVADDQWIKSIELDDSKFQKRVRFNPGLNAIIGGKSSGKSILMYEIAKAAGESNLSQLISDGTWVDPYSSSLKDVPAHLTLGNGQVISPDQELKVLYLPQLFINKISESFNNPYLQSLVRRNLETHEVIFEKIREFEQSRDTLVTLLSQKTQSYKQLANKNAKLLEQQRELGSAENIAERLQALKDVHKELSAQLNISDEDRKELEIRQKEISVLESDIETLTSHKATGTRDLNSIQNLQTRIKEDFDSGIFSADIETKIDVIISGAISQLDKIHDGLQDQDTEITENIHHKQMKIDVATSQIEPIVSKQNRAKELGENNEAQKKTQESQRLLEQIQKKIQENQDKLSSIHTDIKQAIQSTVDLGQSVSSAISGKVITSNLMIHSQFGIDQERYSDLIIAKLDGRKHQKASDLGFSDPILIEPSSIADWWSQILIDTMNGKFTDLLNKSTTDDDFLNSEIRIPLVMPLDIEKDNDLLKLMSPGKRAIVILELLLSQPISGQFPILMDQPEDNLDNRSISQELVELLRTVSEQRQIIMITHNANLVVLSDADEVIVANQDPTISENMGNQFEYYSGPLENSTGISKNPKHIASKGIRDNITDILEGGIEAFEKREQKYLLNSNRS